MITPGSFMRAPEIQHVLSAYDLRSVRLATRYRISYVTKGFNVQFGTWFSRPGIVYYELESFVLVHMWRKSKTEI